MAILRLLFQRGTPCRLRLMAIANVFACSFVIFMTLLTTAISFCVIVPSIFSHNERLVTVHRCVIAYLFINVCGNFLLCLYVDTSTACAKRVKQRRKGKGNAPPKTAAAAREKTSQKCNRKVSDGASYKTNDANAVVKDSLLSAASDPHCQSPPKSKVSDSSSLKFTGSKSSVQSSNDDATKHNQTNTTSSNLDDTCGAFKVSPAEAASGESPSTHAPERSKTDAPKSSGAGAPKSASSETDQPERSHYCKLCEKQILRRDHHCFFMTVCVGYHNHKHFIFFCLYMMIGALYGVVLTARFLNLLYRVRFWGPQTFVFLILQLFENVFWKKLIPTPFFCLLIFQLYICLLVGMAAGGFFYWHVAITSNGQTTHEATRGDTRYRRRLTSNLRDVFGQFWPLLFLLPLPLPQAGDGRRYTAVVADAAAAAVDGDAGKGARGKSKGAAAAKDNKVSAKKRNQDHEVVKGENPVMNSDGGSVSPREMGTINKVGKRRKGNRRAGMVKLTTT